MSANTIYNNEGEHLQMKYCKEIADGSDTIFGITSKHGVVLITESQKQPKIIAQKAMNIFFVNGKICMAATGKLNEAYMFLDMLHETIRKYENLHEENIPLHVLVKELAYYLHIYATPIVARIPGMAMLLASWDDKRGPQLYKIYGTGEWEGVSACAIGSRSEMVQTELKELCYKSMPLKALTKSAAQIMKCVFDDELNMKRLDIAVMGKETTGKYLINNRRWRAIAKIPAIVSSDEDESSSCDEEEEDAEKDGEVKKFEQ